MKPKLFPFFFNSLLTILLTSQVYAQSNRILYDSIAGSIQTRYNARQPENVYAITTAAFRQKMTEEQFATGMRKFYAKAGRWNTLTFSASNEKGMDYLAVFENSRQLFSIKLDDQGKISRLNFAVIPEAIASKKYLPATNNPLKDTTDLFVEQLVRPYIQKANTSGLILAIIHKGEIRKYSYGTVNKSIKQLPDPEKTIFELGSVTKTFTSLLLAKEVISGNMKSEDPINRYLPDSIPALNYQGHAVKLKHLANHTSGFPRLPGNIFNGKIDPQDPYKHYMVDSLYAFLMRFSPTVMPGTTFSYSNYGAGLLGTLLERKHQRSFEQLVVSEICEPLGMYHTCVTLSNPDQKNFAQGYNEKGEATAPWDLASLKGSGAIRSTLNDMIVYTRAQMGGNNPLKKAISLSHKPTFSSKEQHMALGWRISTLGKNTWLHHSGGTGGFRSFVGFDESRQLGIVILSNAAEDVTTIAEAFFSNQIF